ncbi:MAG: hypothetical protein H0Z35_02125 [Thermoanaerobacteraceae bacterium]|nr:hypothetical protein [Thermoanaerobacteraceae bacterium]
MIHQLKELVDHIIACIEIEDHKSAMQAIAHFTVQFEEFIQENKDYIFDQEIANLNRCLVQMMDCMEQNDLQGLREIINSTLKCFLDDWDFYDDAFIN